MIKLPKTVSYYQGEDLYFPCSADYTTYYVYKKGKVIATLNGHADLSPYKEDGCMIEKDINQDDYKAAKSAYRNEMNNRYNAFTNDLIHTVVDEIDDLTPRELRVIDKMYSVAYEQGHSAGVEEVMNMFDDLTSVFFE